MLLTPLVLLALASGVSAKAGSLCTSPHGNSAPCVCVTKWECDRASGNQYDKRCPNDPANIKCCVAYGCYRVEHNRCPGGGDVKYVPELRYCARVKAGLCPGAKDYMYVVGPYP